MPALPLSSSPRFAACAARSLAGRQHAGGQIGRQATRAGSRREVAVALVGLDGLVDKAGQPLAGGILAGGPERAPRPKAGRSRRSGSAARPRSRPAASADGARRLPPAARCAARGRRAHRACRRGSTRPCRSAPSGGSSVPPWCRVHSTSASPSAAATASSRRRSFRPHSALAWTRAMPWSAKRAMASGASRQSFTVNSFRGCPGPAGRATAHAGAQPEVDLGRRVAMQFPLSGRCEEQRCDRAVTRGGGRAGLSCARRSVRSQNSVCMGRSRA